MNIASRASRILLGLLFVVFGLNGFLSFIPMGPMPGAAAGEFMGALMTSHYMTVVFVLELVSGLLLLSNQFVPLALTMLAPVIFNILLFHTFMAPSGLGLAFVVTILWLLTASRIWPVFSGLLQRRIAV